MTEESDKQLERLLSRDLDNYRIEEQVVSRKHVNKLRSSSRRGIFGMVLGGVLTVSSMLGMGIIERSNPYNDNPKIKEYTGLSNVLSDGRRFEKELSNHGRYRDLTGVVDKLETDIERLEREPVIQEYKRINSESAEPFYFPIGAGLLILFGSIISMPLVDNYNGKKYKRDIQDLKVKYNQY